MALAEQRGKDAAMAARLRGSATHGGNGVRAYKARRFAGFMASLHPGIVGSAKYQRLRRT